MQGGAEGLTKDAVDDSARNKKVDLAFRSLESSRTSEFSPTLFGVVAKKTCAMRPGCNSFPSFRS